MKLIGILTFTLGLTWSYASVYSQGDRLTVRVKNMTVKDVLRQIEEQSEYSFMYNASKVNIYREVDVDIENSTVNDVLNEIFSGENVYYKVLERNILLFSDPDKFANIQIIKQEIVVKGKVTDVSGNSLPGVNVVEKGTTNGAVTNLDGEYSISVSSPDAILSFSYVGFLSEEIEVNGQSSLDITLVEDITSLDEVVVIGYGVQRKVLSTGASVNIGQEELANSNTLQIDQALQGQVAGVQISSTSGQPGENMKVRIRGISTTGDASPLYIVDGMPTGDIKYLNTNDIESISVLKDAASAAIYGSRGANGVVLITTKKGEQGKMVISYDGYYGIQTVAKKVDVLNAEQYATVLNEFYTNSGANPPFTSDEIAQMGEGTNWQDEIFSTAPIQNHHITLTGGNDKTIFSSALSYFNQEGIVGTDKSYFDRISFRINTESKFLKDDALIFGQHLTFSHTKKGGIDINNEFGSPIASAFNMSPTTPVRDENGEYGISEYIDQGIVNPVAQLDYLFNQENQGDKVLGDVYLSYEILKGLKFKTSFGIDLAYQSYYNYTPIYTLNEIVKSENTFVETTFQRWLTWNFENTLTYSSSIENHNFSLLAGTTALESGYRNLGASKSDLIKNGFRYALIDNATNDESTNAWGGLNENALVSYFGRISYDYDSKYLLEAILRADGSSRFGKENKFGYFPSLSLGWIISREPFMNLPWLQYFKVRTSWGQNGNQEIGDFRYLATISKNYYYTLGEEQNSVVGSTPNKVANPNLKWETSEQFNIGLDSRIFEAFDLSVDWYRKETKDWLVTPPIPGYVGSSAPTINGGSVLNKGVEIELSYKNYERAFKYSIGINGAYNKNEVISISNAEGIIHGPSITNSISEVSRVEVGYPIGYFWGYQTKGIFQNQTEIDSHVGVTENGETKILQPNAVPGDLIYEDTNMDGEISEDDRVMIGDPNPDFTFGLNISATYKNFDISALFSGVAGNQIYFFGIHRSDIGTTNWPSVAFERWHGEGTSNSFPRISQVDNNRNFLNSSDIFLRSGDYLRMKNITLGYDFKSILKDVNISQIRLYGSIQNLFTLTKYPGLDPDIGSGKGNSWTSGLDLGYYPSPRTFMLGLNIKF